VDLLERGALLETLSAELAEARNGDGRLVLLAGEAGVGKSALTRTFCDRRATTATVLWGACDALRTARPLGPVHDIARTLGGGLAEAIATAQPRHELFTALLDALCPPRGARLVVIDDVHWADEATLDLLMFLGRRIRQTRALVIAVYRDDEVRRDSPLQTVLGDLATARGVRRLRVDALSRAAVAELARDSAVNVDRLFEVTKGNPFYVTEVLAAGQTADVPGTVRDAVHARVARLSATGRALLDLVAAVPDRAELALVRAASHPSWAVDECLQAGLLRADGSGIRFRHELARLAVETAIPAAQRAGVHAEVLHYLAQQPDADPARLAHHADEAGDAPAVLRHAVAAARQAAALGAHRQAAAQYERALRAGTALPLATRADMLELLAAQRRDAGDIDAALAAAEEAVAVWRRLGEVQRLGKALARRAWLLRSAVRNVQALESSREAVQLLEPHPPGPGLAAALASMAFLHMFARDIPAALEVGARAVEVSEAVGDHEMLTCALNAVGSAQWFVEPDVAATTLERSYEMAREHGEDYAAATALVNQGSAAGEVRRYDAAAHWLRESIAWCSARDLDAIHSYATGWLARLDFEQGHWPAATKLAAGTLQASPRYLIARIVALTVIGRLRARRGDPDAAGPLDEAWQLATSTGELQRLWPVAAGRAEVAWLAGRPDDIPALIEDVYAQSIRLRHAWAIGELGFWLWQSERASTATAEPGWFRPSPAANAARELAAEPYARQLAGDWGGAATAWRALGCPYEEATALAETDSERDLQRALEQWDGLGARPAADLLVRRLRRMGQPVPRRPRRSTVENPNGLTNRQAEILPLLTAGLRNIDIAAALHISTKTVDHHVSAILGKLGVASRREAAQRLASSKEGEAAERAGTRVGTLTRHDGHHPGAAGRRGRTRFPAGLVAHR
jgi:DNA-binding CsgD family transcriptional regulator/tetratricopeptide (TPR) repeat protein